MSESAAIVETRREPLARPVLAVVFALAAPILCAPLMIYAAGWTYTILDRGGPRGVWGLLFMSVLLVPCAQAVAVFAITRSRIARIVGGLLALISTPWYLALLLMESWLHH